MSGVDTKVERRPVLPEGARYRIVPLGRRAKVREYWKIVGMQEVRSFIVHNASLKNFKRALFERVFNVDRGGQLAPTPQPVAGAFNRLTSFKRRLVSTVGIIPPVSAEKFVDRYTGRRHTIYMNALEKLKLTGMQRKYAYMNSFIKSEKVAVTAVKKDPAPRMIQPRSPCFNIGVGRYISHMEKPICRGIGRIFGHPTVMKGYNAHETGRLMREKWEMFDDPVGVGLDAERFDQHTSVHALRYEHSCYVSMVPVGDRKEIRRLLSWQLENKGFANMDDGRVSYTVQGCRMSGDMNTGLGNCLLMCAMIHAYASERFKRFQLANNGDDCVLIIERRDLQRMADLPEWFLEMGYTMKVEEPVDVFEEIEFCQTQPVFDGERWVMCRNPKICMPKDCVSLIPMNQGNAGKAWMTAVGECGMSLSGGLPILQEFYSRLIKAGDGKRMKEGIHMETGFFNLARGMDRHYKPVSVEARVSFWKAFGVTPTMQEILESQLRRWDVSALETPRENYIALLYPQ